MSVHISSTPLESPSAASADPAPHLPRRRRWYQRDRFIVLLFVAAALTLLLAVPLGLAALVLMWRYTTWPKALKWLLSLIVPAPLYAVLAAFVLSLASGTVSQLTTPPTLGTLPLTAPRSVAGGLHDSLYVVDGQTILHLTDRGQVLGRLGSTDAAIAADSQGHLYVAQHGEIHELSPGGTLLRRWASGPVQLVAVDRHGTVYATQDTGTPTGLTRVLRFAPSGRLLARWLTAYGSAFAVARDGTIFGIGGPALGDLARLDPVTGRVLQRWTGGRNGTMTYDAVAADAQGTIYVGSTRDGDTPFAIQRLSYAQRTWTFTTINTAQELVAGLAITPQGTMYVIRNSYARPCPSNLGMDELSPQGTVVGTFRSCPAGS